MGNPFLLVQTPRAGSKNHRFLVSRDSGLDDARASQILASALERMDGDAKAVGRDFLAVGRRGVLQVGADRTGDEVLLLGGIDIDRLANERRQRVLDRLGERLTDLKEVIGGIDWERSSEMLLEEGHLDEWLRRDFPWLPAGTKASRTPWVIKAGIPTAILLTALGAAVVCAQIKELFGPARTNTAPTPGRATDRPSDKDTSENRFAALLKEWRLEDKREDALQDLATIAGIEEKVDPTHWLQDLKVGGFLAEASKSPRASHALYFFDKTEYGKLTDLHNYDRLTNRSVLEKRKVLSDVVKFIREFREEVRKEDSQSLKVDEYPYLQTAKAVATTRQPSADLFEVRRGLPPVLPVFSRYDQKALEEIPPFLDKALHPKVKTKIGWQEGQTLVDQLQVLKDHKDELRKELNLNLDTILSPTAKDSQPPDPGLKERIQHLKVKFDTLLGQLARADLKSPPGEH